MGKEEKGLGKKKNCRHASDDRGGSCPEASFKRKVKDQNNAREKGSKWEWRQSNGPQGERQWHHVPPKGGSFRKKNKRSEG